MAQASVEEFRRVTDEHREILVEAMERHPNNSQTEIVREKFHLKLNTLTLKEQYEGIIAIKSTFTVSDTYIMSLTLRNSCLSAARTDAYVTEPEIRHYLIVFCGNTQFVSDLEEPIRARFNWSMKIATKRDIKAMNQLKDDLAYLQRFYPKVGELKKKLDKIAVF